MTKESNRQISDSKKQNKDRPAATKSYQSPVSAAQKFQSSLANTTHLKVIEGLPHQQSERSLFEKELRRRNLKRISGYPFYSPGKKVVDPKPFKTLLADTANIEPWNPKYCGEFHPDYALEWPSPEKSFFVLVCFGCREIIFSDGTQKLRYDLTSEARDDLRTLLKPYAAKRPIKKDPPAAPDAPADPFSSKR